VLNESRSSPAVWRARLEARFGVSTFLRWLALNTIIGTQTPTVGFSAQLLVYGSPRHQDRLFSFLGITISLNAGGPGASPGAGAVADVFHDRVSASWPLIQCLLDDPHFIEATRVSEHRIRAVAVTTRLQAEYVRTPLT
jgi:hypothetical protein